MTEEEKYQDELRKAQLEYKQRINDPSYVAPAILRSQKKSAGSYVGNMPKQDDAPKSLNNYLVNKSASLSPAESSYSQELAKAHGIEMSGDVPVLTPEQEVFLNKSIDKSVEGLDLSSDERNILNLMIGPDWEKK